MTDSNNDLNHAVLNLTEQEKRAYGFLFTQADSDQLGVVTGERAVTFFERTRVGPDVLGEIWQIADTENRGLLTKPGFCMVLRLIGHYQAGREPSAELAFKPAPIPKFEGMQIPGVGAGAVPSPTAAGFPANALQSQSSGQGPIRVPPLDAQKVQQYSGLFERSGAQNGMLDGITAKSIFERAGLPNEVLGKIWSLSDREQRGALDQTEFIVAMHLLTSMKTRTMTALPNTLPQPLYDAAARRGVPPPPRQGTGPVPAAAIPRQFTGGSAGAPPRTQSPLTRVPPGYAAPPTVSAQTTGTAWLITPQEKAKYDQFFATIDTQDRGIISGEQAVRFFSDSRLPEDALATIWDLADINSEGQLNKDEFAVAMYLIRQQRMPNAPPLPAFLPPALIPPSMRQQQQSAQSTAPAFDNANNTSNMPKSATEDLFGLDEPSQPAPVLQPQQSGFPQPLQAQTTGASTSRDPFGGSAPGSPTSPQRFQPSPQQSQQSTMFKPFMPTSAFGASLAQQHTGGSTSSSQRGFPPQSQPSQPSHLHQASASEDLLGDNDANAAESSKITNETTELANMSNQIGNLRTQMESTQSNKSKAQVDLNATNQQKQALEQRLQQFRAQYEQEVRAVKELETQLAASRESTKKLSQEHAMLEGTYHDLQTQHASISQQLQADQQENAGLKQKISQMNAEVARLKPEIEKMKLDARQQKGLVSINKKQLATNEGERDNLQSEKADLEREAAEREEAERNAPTENDGSHFARDAAIGAGAGAVAFGGYEAMKDRHAGSGVASPSGPGSDMASPSAMSSTNPFFRKASGEGPASPLAASNTGGPTPSAFDALFGPSATFAPSGHAGSRTGTPPATSFIGRNVPAAPTGPGMTDSIQSVSSNGEPTPSATPPLSDPAKETPTPATEIPPPPPETRQFTPSQLPVVGLADRTREESDNGSTSVVPPASRAGGTDTPAELERTIPGAFDEPEYVPGSFPSEESRPATSTQELKDEESAAPAAQSSVNDDFDSAFAGFGEGEKTKEAPKEEYDPFAPTSASQPQGRGFSSEFPPITSLESEDDESSVEEGGFDDDFTAASPPRKHAPAEIVKGNPESSMLAPSAAAAGPSTSTEETNIAGARPAVASVASTACAVPSISQQQPPPTYEESDQPSHGGHDERSDSTHFPREYGDLLPAREDPTSPSHAAAVPEQAVVDEVEKEKELPSGPSALQMQPPPAQSLAPAPQTPSTADFFHDASSRPMSSVTDAPFSSSTTSQPSAPPQQQSNNTFDDFDDFDDLAEAKEEDPASSSTNDFGHSQHEEAFNPAFDSSPRTMTTSSAYSEQQTPKASSSSHDWDAIFSGLDKDPAPAATALGGASSGSAAVGSGSAVAARDDPWSTTSTTTAPAAAAAANATAAPEEEDDPILKRLTGMGYPRDKALGALEMFDYDINKAVDHLTEGSFG